MQKHKSLLFLLLMWATLARGTDVVIPLTLTTLGVNQPTNRTIYIQRLSVPDMVNGSVVIGDKIKLVTDTNGVTTLTNAFIGLYAATVQAPPSATAFKFLVTATNLGTIYVGDIMVADSSATFPAGAVAYSTATSDARYARSTTSLSNYVTSADWASSNLVLQTQISSNRVNLTAVSNTATAGSTAITTLSNLLGTASRSNSSAFQPSATTLTNWALHSTNDYMPTNVNLAAWSQHPTNHYMPTNSNLTDWGNVTTNQLVGTNAFRSFTNGTTSIIYSNSAVFVSLAAYQSFTNQIGTAGFSSVNAFQPASTSLTNFSALTTNAFVSTNDFEVFTNSLGSLAYSSATDFVTTNDFETFTNTLGSAAYLARTTWQATNSQLTIWQQRLTNEFVYTNDFIGFTNQVGTAAFKAISFFQPSNSVLTDFVTLGTNYAYPRASNPSNYVTASVTNGLATTNYASRQVITNIVAGSNITLSTNGDKLTITGSAGGITTAIKTLNGLSNTNQTFSAEDSGADFAIVTPGGGTNHEFRLPVASATHSGKVTNTDWILFNGKQAGSTVLSNFVTLTTNAFYNTNANLQAGSTNLTNWSTFTTNKFYHTNQNLQAGSTNLTNWATFTTNQFYSTNANLQAGSVSLTNFSLLTTNSFYNTNAYLQAGSLNLTNFSALTTNTFYPRANPSNFVDATVTNGLATTNYASRQIVTNIVAGSNITLVTNGDKLTIASTASGSSVATNYYPFATNGTLYKATLLDTTTIKYTNWTIGLDTDDASIPSLLIVSTNVSTNPIVKISGDEGFVTVLNGMQIGSSGGEGRLVFGENSVMPLGSYPFVDTDGTMRPVTSTRNTNFFVKQLTAYSNIFAAGKSWFTNQISLGLEPSLTNEAATLWTVTNKIYTLAVTTNILQSKGDLLVRTGSNTLTRLQIGSDGQVLVSDSSQSLGLRYVANTPTASGTDGAIQYSSSGTTSSDQLFRWNTSFTSLILGNTNTSTTPTLSLYRGTVGAGQNIGAIGFSATNTIGQLKQYSQIKGRVFGGTSSGEGGEIAFVTFGNGLGRENLTVTTNGISVPQIQVSGFGLMTITTNKISLSDGTYLTNDVAGGDGLTYSGIFHAESGFTSDHGNISSDGDGNLNVNGSLTTGGFTSGSGSFSDLVSFSGAGFALDAGINQTVSSDNTNITVQINGGNWNFTNGNVRLPDAINTNSPPTLFQATNALAATPEYFTNTLSTFTNIGRVASIEMLIKFVSAATGVPSATIDTGHSSLRLTPIAGGLLETVTNLVPFQVAPNAIVSVSDTSTGTGCSIQVLTNVVFAPSFQ